MAIPKNDGQSPVSPEPKEDVEKLINNHWAYVKDVLEAHGTVPEDVKLAEFHYKTAFMHGYKHALEADKTNIDPEDIDPEEMYRMFQKKTQKNPLPPPCPIGKDDHCGPTKRDLGAHAPGESEDIAGAY